MGVYIRQKRKTAPGVLLLLIGTCLLFRWLGSSAVHPCDEFVGRRFGIGRPSLGL